MKAHYDFATGKRGPVLKTPGGKTRITIRIDDDLLQWFRKQVHGAGGGSYQTLINAALREYVSTKREPLEATLRRVLREELPRDLKRAAGRRKSVRGRRGPLTRVRAARSGYGKRRRGRSVRLRCRESCPLSTGRVLGVSRQVIVSAYEELVATGHLRSRTGDGSYVAWTASPPGRESIVRLPKR